MTIEAIIPVATKAVKKLFIKMKQTAAIQQTVPTKDCHKSVGRLSTRSKKIPWSKYTEALNSSLKIVSIDNLSVLKGSFL